MSALGSVKRPMIDQGKSMLLSADSVLSRRNWLFAVGAAPLVSSSLSASGIEAESDAGWIDAHVHVWTPDTTAYPLDKSFKVADMQPPSFTPEELFAHSKPVGVSRIVLIQMSFYGTDNRYMTDVIAKHHGVFSGVGIVDHHAPELVATMKGLAKQGVRGFRLHPKAGEAAGWSRDDGMALLWRTARENHLACCPLINPADLPAVEAMCKKFPGTSVVIDHFARIGVSGAVEQVHLETLCRLAKFPDVNVKTSAFYALGKKTKPYDDLIPMIRRLVDAYGPKRLMWATDCPYQVQKSHTYADSLTLIRDRTDFLSAADKSAILRETAQRIFFS
jgi:predicted TIM-barrel fold metal-dependent hydrolase